MNNKANKSPKRRYKFLIIEITIFSQSKKLQNLPRQSNRRIECQLIVQSSRAVIN